MKDESVFTHVLFHDDLTQLPVGSDALDGFRVIARGMGKYIECSSPSSHSFEPHTRLLGDNAWRDYQFRAVVTPVSFETSNPNGVFCGIVARYRSSTDYIALVLDRDDRVKLLRRTRDGFELLAFAPLEFCIGQSLSLTLAVRGNEIVGTAGPYAGATTIRATVDGSSPGKVGFITTTFCRFGPHTVECEPTEVTRIEKSVADAQAALKKKRAAYPQMKLERTVPLNGLATGRNIEFADVDGDGKLEILAAQSSRDVAEQISLTRLTCLTAINLDGKILWQAGMPSADGTNGSVTGSLPFRFHDVFGDKHPVVVCVFGYDIQIRHAKTGRLMMSAQTPSTTAVSDEFKAVVGVGGGIRYGDETLNMDVSRIAFCDTQGTGLKKEIIVSDGFNLAVLDPLAEPTLYPIFKHRGDLRGGIWSGDLDGDGKDEIIAGKSVLNDDGSLLNTIQNYLPGSSLSIFDSATEIQSMRLCVSNGDEGMWVYNAKEFVRPNASNDHRPQRIRGGYYSHVVTGKLRADLPGDQFVSTAFDTITFFDANFNKIGTHQFEGYMPFDGPRVVNWTDKPERLLLIAAHQQCGLVDGFGDRVVTLPDEFAEHGYREWDVIPGYCADGRDALAAWNTDVLSIFVPAE